MTVSASISLDIKTSSTVYSSKLEIPAAAPTNIAPFHFSVASHDDKGAAQNTLLQVAVGADSNIFVAVAPPQDLLSKAAGDVVQNLKVLVEQGKYDEKTGQFTA